MRTLTITSFTMLFLALGAAVPLRAQTVQGGLFGNQNVLTVRVKPSGTITGTSVSNLVFSIRWDTSYHISVSDMTNSFGIGKDGGIQTSGTYNYQDYASTSPTAINWAANTEVDLGTITVTGGTGTGTFELSPAGFTAGGNGDWYVEIGGVDHTPPAGSLYYQSTAVANLAAAGPAAKLGIQTQPASSATAGVAFAPQPVVRIEDASGNLETGDNSTVVTAVRLTGTGALQGTLTATASGGLATFANLSYNVEETMTIRFSAGSLTSITSNNVVVGPGPAAAVRVETAANGTGTVVPPQSVPSGSSVTMYAITRDAFGNFGANVAADLWTLANLTGGAAAGDLVPSGDMKSAVFTGHLIGTGNVFANFSGLTRTPSGTLTVTAGPASQIRVETASDGSGVVVPSQSLATTNSITVYAVTRDASANFVANSAATWSLPLTTGAVTPADLVASGDTKSAVFTGHGTGTAQIRAASGVLTPVNSGTITVTTSAATRVQFAAEPSGTTSGTTLAPVTVQLKDAVGINAAVPGVQISVSLLGTGTLTGTLTRSTDATGLATFNDLKINLVGTKQLTATSAGLTPDTSVAFAITPGAAKKLVFVQPPSAAHTNIPIAPAITVQLQDSAGNSVPSSGIAVGMTKSSGTGTLSGTTAQFTDGTGLATFGDLKIDLTGLKQLTASGTGLTSAISPSFTVSTFTITAAASGSGTIAPSGSVAVNGTANQTFTMTPSAGFHVDSVVVDGVNQGAVASYPFTNVTADHAITAYFSINIWTITATAGVNGTIAPSGSVQVTNGGSQSFTMTPSTGYHIDSVLVDGAYAGNTSPFQFTNVTANHSINAKFAINTFTITASAGIHGKITPAGAVPVNYGASQLFTMTPDTGYHVLNVLADGVAQGAVPTYTFTNVTANHTISSTYAADSITVVVQASPSFAGAQVVVDGSTFASPKTVRWLAATNHTVGVVDTVAGATGTRYVWGSWSDGGAKSHIVSALVNTTYTANFTTQYLLTMAANTGGSVTPPSGWFNSGQGVQITAIPLSTYDFAVWAGTGSGSVSNSVNPATVTMNGPISETANFSRKPIQITIQAVPAGRSFVYDGTPYTTPQTRTVVPGDPHTVDIFQLDQPDPSRPATVSYHWTSWSDGGAKFHSLALPDTNTTYTASFGTQFKLNVVAGSGGSVSPASNFFDSLSTQQIQAFPNTGFIFKSWKGSGPGSFTGTSNPASVTMNGAINDTALFAVDTVIITATAGANGTITPSGSVKVPYGSGQTFNIAPTGLYHISDVVVDGFSVGAVTSYTFPTVTVPHTIAASFTINGYTITATAGANGTISPSGPVGVSGGASQSFTMTPNFGYHLDSVIVDGVYAGNTSPYQFTNVSANHTIRSVYGASTFSVTVASAPAGLTILGDGAAFPSPHVFSWLYGTAHTIAAADTQSGGAGVRYLYNTWSDGGGKSHTITVGGDSTFTAAFGTQYFLTMNAQTGGTVAPPSGWFGAGASVPISASPATGNSFSAWAGSGAGSYTGPANPSSVTMNAPITETASFGTATVTVNISTAPAGRSFTVDGTTFTTPQTFGWTYGTVHTVATSTPQVVSPNTRYVWANWNDGKAISHSVTALNDTSLTATFVTQYLLTMNVDSGGTTGPASGFQNAGSAVQISAIPSPGWRFTGWTGTGSGSTTDTLNPSLVTMNGPVTETAHFTRFGAQVTVATNPAGLKITVDNVDYASPQTFTWTTGSQHTIAAIDTASGGVGTRYVFSAWSDGKAIAHAAGANTDTTFTASFRTQYFLTTSAGTGGTVTPQSGWFNAASSVQITGVPDARYQFSSWSGTGTGSTSGFTSPATITMGGPITETANFVRAPIQIVIQSSPAGRPFIYDGVTYTNPQTQTVAPGTQHFLGANDPQSAGVGIQYIYQGWSDGGSQFHTIFPDSAQTYTVTFSKQFYLTTVAGLGGTVSPFSDWQDSGKSVQITGTPNPAYSFVQWKGRGAGSYTGFNNPATVTMSAPVFDTASFSQFAIHVTVQSNPPGQPITVDGIRYDTTQVLTWTSGTSHSMTASFQNGDTAVRYLYDHWSDGGGLTHTVTPVGDSTFTAVYATQYYLHMIAGPGGTVSPSSDYHDAGSVVPISASPALSYSFGAWNGTGNGSYSGKSQSSSVTMNGPITESGSFLHVPVHITVKTYPAGRSFTVDSVAYTAQQTFVWEFGSSHAIGTTSPQAFSSNTQYAWKNWSDGGAMAHTISATLDTTLTAVFIPQYYLTMTSDTGGTVSPGIGWQDSGKAVQITGIPHAGFQFASWTGTGAGSYSGTTNPSSITMAGPIMESASFNRFNASVVVRTNPAGLLITVDGTQYTSPHSFSWTTGSSHTISSIDTTLPSGGTRYAWNAWNDGGVRTHTVVPSADTTYLASYTTQYFLTMSAGAGGRVTPASGWFNANQTVTVTGIPDARYDFSSWSGTGTGSTSSFSSPSTVTMGGPITETANFVRKPVQIVIQAQPAGRPFVYDGVTYTDPQTQTVVPGTQHFLGANSPQPAGGGAQYVYKQWSDGGDQFHSIFPDSAQTYTVTFGKQFMLTTAAGPGGSAAPASGFQDSGKVVTITGTGDTRYAFGQWRGSGSGSYTGTANPATVTMNEPIVDSAFFLPAVQVVVASDPAGRLVLIDDSLYTAPKTVFWISGSNHTIATSALQAGTAGTRYLWKAWSDTGAISHTASAKRDTTFTASFATQFFLTVNGSSGGTVAPASTWFPKDTTVVIRGTADPGHAFVEWNGSGTGSYSGANSTANVAMAGPITEAATFGLILSPPTLAGIGNDSTGLPTSPTLSWNAYSGAASYRLQLSTDSTLNADGTFRTTVYDSATIHTTSVQVNGLANLTMYYWHVSARVGNNITSFSGAWRFRTVTATLALGGPIVNWATGYYFTITWQSSALSGPVDILLSLDGGTTWRTVRQGIANTGSTLWKVPDSVNYASITSRLRIASTLNPAIRNESATFTIYSGSLPGTVPLSNTLPFPAEPTVSTEYRLVSAPGIVDTVRIGRFMSGNQKTDWRIYSDDGSAGSSFLHELSAGSLLQTGAGYWFIRKGDFTIPAYSMVMPRIDTLAMFAIPLHAGWNIIANPFNRTVSWQAIVTANGLGPATQLFTYEGSYAQAAELDPFTGYYYFNASNAGALKIPYPFGGVAHAVTAPAAAAYDWKVRLTLASDINKDPENFIGVAAAAKPGNADYDQHKPPLFLDQSFLYFPRPEWDATYSRFSSDIRRELGEGQTWTFTASNPRKSHSTITVDGLDAVPPSMSVVLVDEWNSTPYDLRKSNVYAYQAVSPSTPFRILVGTKAYVAAELGKLVPSEFELAQNFPNPFNNSTSISVKLPHDAQIRLDVYSVLGQRVATLANDRFTGGVHTFLWDGRDETGELAASGVYFYRLMEGNNLLQTKKMVLTK